MHVPVQWRLRLTRFESLVLIFRCFLISVINRLFSEHFELNYSLGYVVSYAMSCTWSIQAKPISKHHSYITQFLHVDIHPM